MCFSAEASYISAAILIPAGSVAIHRAYNKNQKYLALSFLPLLFGLQQLFEGLIWIGYRSGDQSWVEGFSLAYMFFAWLAWPVWVPFSTFFLEPCRRRYLYLVFAILGGMLGGVQYVPYFAHDNWLVTRVLENAISYEGTILFDLIMGREITNIVYLFVILAPLLTSSEMEARVFGALLSFVALVTYLVYTHAYVSAFCFGAALMSAYLLFIVFRKTEDPGHPRQAECRASAG